VGASISGGSRPVACIRQKRVDITGRVGDHTDGAGEGHDLDEINSDICQDRLG
jgi:hypothetical protein